MKLRVVILLILTIVAGWLRFTATDFGLPDKYRPDEEFLINGAMDFQADWNPHFEIYPAAQMYVDHAVLKTYAQLQGNRGDFRDTYSADGGALAYLVVRRISAAFGTATVPIIYLAGEAAFGWEAGLLSAAILTFTTLHVRDSKYATTDVVVAFWVSVALWMVMNIIRRGRYLDYLLAGLFAGLAIATKYPAGVVVFAIGVAHLECRRREGRALLGAVLDSRIYLAGLAVALAFFCATPYVVLDWSRTVSDYGFEMGILKTGANDLAAPWGWTWLLFYAARYSFGVIIEVLFIASIAYALWRWRPGFASLLALLAAAFFGMTSSKWVFYRYLIIPLPALILLAGAFVSDVHSYLATKLGPRTAMRATLAAMILILIPSFIRDWELNHLFSQTDTRIMAGRWMETHIPQGSAIAATGPVGLGRPQFGGYNFVSLESVTQLKAKGIRWVFSDSYPPLPFYSPGVSEQQLADLQSSAVLVFDVDPFLPGDGVPRVDREDAFYAPISNISSVERPGPRIRIWKLD
jgi:hypothetical protein